MNQKNETSIAKSSIKIVLVPIALIIAYALGGNSVLIDIQDYNIDTSTDNMPTFILGATILLVLCAIYMTICFVLAMRRDSKNKLRGKN